MKNVFKASPSFVLNTRWKPINWEYLDFPLDVFGKNFGGNHGFQSNRCVCVEVCHTFVLLTVRVCQVVLPNVHFEKRKKMRQKRRLYDLKVN